MLKAHDALRFVPFLLIVFLFACGGEKSADTSVENDSASTAPPKLADTITLAYSVDMRDVNELLAQGTPIHTVLHAYALFLPLMEEQADYQQGPPTFKPRLAEEWEFSEDRLKLTVRLREGAIWSDGEPVTAEDVRWTWEAQTNPDVAYVFAEVKQNITDVEVVDPSTVIFHFSKASASQLIDVNQGSILPRHIWSKLPFDQWRENPAWFQENLVVSGPYTLGEHAPGERIVLTRNPKYFEPDLPKTERIVFRIVPDRTARLAMMRSGEAQMMDNLQPADTSDIEANPELKLLTYVHRQFTYLCWNVNLPIFADVDVRRALTHAIDRQEIVDTIYRGYAKVSYTPYMSNVWARNTALEPLPYDPAKASELLAAAGWSDTDDDGILDKDGKPFRFEMLNNASNELRADILVLAQEHLRRVGIEMDIRPMEFNSKIEKEMRNDFEASFASFGISTDLNVSYFYHSKQPYNFGRYADPELDALFDQIADFVDPFEARDLYNQMQEILQRDQPVTFLYEPLRMIAADKDLYNVDPNALSAMFNIRFWELHEDP